MKVIKWFTLLLPGIVLLMATGCASAPAQPDYRVEQQRQGADKAQQELSREIKKSQ